MLVKTSNFCKNKKKYLWGNFHIWAQKFLHIKKILENGKLRSKVPSASQNTIFCLIPPRFDYFEKILTEILRKKIFSRLYKKGCKRSYKHKKGLFYPFFEGFLYASPIYHKYYWNPSNRKKSYANRPFLYVILWRTKGCRLHVRVPNHVFFNDSAKSTWLNMFPPYEIIWGFTLLPLMIHKGIDTFVSYDW